MGVEPRTTISISDGRFEPESWVYVWWRPQTGEVAYVGATGLPLAVRTWLHLNDERPEVGRVRVEAPHALEGEITVRGFRVPKDVDRQLVRQAVADLLQSEGVGASLPSTAERLAHTIVEELSEPPGS